MVMKNQETINGIIWNIWNMMGQYDGTKIYINLDI
jgi:hypothetical protein